MFIDASAVIAILTREEDAGDLMTRLSDAETVEASPMVLYESALGVARIVGISVMDALGIVERFLEQSGGTIIAMDQTIGRAAVAAHHRYGRGNHKAALNMGDCFAYACAHQLNVPLLCKGNDFPRTDIELA
jgi:ribonuclease VapC